MNKNQIQLLRLWQTLTRMRVALFVLVVVVLYGFIVWRIQVLTVAQPDAAAIAEQAHASNEPHIDPALVSKIEQLKDTNVSVQALFDQARQNPFRE